MKQIIGTSNRVLNVDLNNQTFSEFMLTDAERLKYLGGKGMGLKILSERLPERIDPLDQHNILVFMMGPLMGTGAPCTGRFAALTKSPLTGIVVTSSCGGPFGLALKTAGYDGLVISGKAQAPVYLQISATGVRFKPAKGLWGLDTQAAQTELNLSKSDGALVIGPAGETLVRYANIATGHRFLGRGGMGAVMGSKNLKAVVARGRAYRIIAKMPAKFKKIARKANRYINANTYTAGWYRNFGTAANVNPCNEQGILPVNNFSSGSHPNAGDVSGETMQARYDTQFSTCKRCSIRCGHKRAAAAGGQQIPEYETVGLLGTNLGIFDTEQITRFNDRCGLLGLDTISTGATLAWVMEAGQKGLINTPLQFGRPEHVLDTIDRIAARKGQGDELANGTRWLSEKYGGKQFAMHVKGLEMAAYDPRGSWGQGLSYAVANRGGCHLSAYLIALEVYGRLLDPYKVLAKPQFVKYFENLTCCINAMHTCQFTMFAYTLEAPLTKYTPDPMLAFLMQYMPRLALALVDFSIYADLWTAVTGLKISRSAFLKAGERIHVLERYLNTREGISRKDDTLPPRLLNEGRAGDLKNRTVPLDRMLDKYYRTRGYDRNGIPTPQTLRKLEILP